MEHDHLEHVAGVIGPEYERAVRRQVVPNINDGERMFDGMQQVVVLYTVFGRCSVKLRTALMYYETSSPAALPAGRHSAETVPCLGGHAHRAGLPAGRRHEVFIRRAENCRLCAQFPESCRHRLGVRNFPLEISCRPNGPVPRAGIDDATQAATHLELCSQGAETGIPPTQFVAWSRVRDPSLRSSRFCRADWGRLRRVEPGARIELATT